MKYYSRRWIKPTDLNPAERLFGGTAMAWMDEEAAIFAACQMGTDRIVTKFISEINFQSSAKMGTVIEFGLEVKNVGRTSLTVSCKIRDKKTGLTIVSIDQIVFVAIDQDGLPTPYKKHLHEMATG
jgi:acyl-CoA hydrolase